MFKKSKKIINIVIEDYVIRLLENTGHSLSSVKLMKEKALPIGLIDNGKIIDEMAFFNFMRELVKEFSLKNRHVRFYVPNSLVIMRQIEFPAHLKGKEVKEYLHYEIGKSVHLPFKKPIFDLHYLPSEINHLESTREMQSGMLFAAPEEELMKYTEIFDDVSLKPIAVDVQALGVYRYYHHLATIKKEQVYLFVELNATSFHLSIYENHQLEFLRYQNLDLHLKGYNQNDETINWEYVEDEQQVLGVLDDQILEIERIMNFYRFSLQKGEKMVNKLIILGDHPLIGTFYHKVQMQFDIPTKLLKAYLSKKMDKEVGPEFIPALGLALKGGTNDAS